MLIEKESSKDNHRVKGICVSRYIYNGKTYLEVLIQKRDKRGRNRRRKARFTSSGKRITSLVVAEQVKAKLRRELESELGQVTTHSWATWFAKTIRQMRREGLKENTIVNCEKVMNKWLDIAWKEKDLESFSRDDVYKLIYEDAFKKGASDSIRHNIHKGVHKVFERAVECGEIKSNPARGIKVTVSRKEALVLTTKEVEVLLSSAKAVGHDYYPHWVLALMTGMRNGELYALRWHDIDFDAGIIQVFRQFTSKDGVHSPKRGKKRPIDLSPNLVSFLYEIKSLYGLSKQKLWAWKENDQSLNGEVKEKQYFVWDDLVLPRLSSWRNGMQAEELGDFCQKIGIKPIKFHDLRATHITNLLSNGVAISRVMKQVGHSRMSTTDGYNRLAGVEVKGVTSNLNYHIPKTNVTDTGAKVFQLFPNKVSR